MLEAMRVRSATTSFVAHAAYELGRDSPRGDPDVLEVAIARLSDVSSEVRRESVFAIGRVANVGDERATEALVGALTDYSQPHVRQQAAEALRWVAKRGNAQVVAALRDAVRGDPHPGVRRDAAHALAEIAEHGDVETVQALLAQLSGNEQHEEVCDFLTHAVGSIASLDNADALFCLLGRLFHGETSRQVAGEALARLFADDDSLPILAMLVARIEKMEATLEDLQRFVSTEGGRSLPSRHSPEPSDATQPGSRAAKAPTSLLAAPERAGAGRELRSPKQQFEPDTRSPPRGHPCVAGTGSMHGGSSGRSRSRHRGGKNRRNGSSHKGTKGPATKR